MNTAQITPCTPWELWASGQEPAGEDMRRLFREYEACASDADRAYARQRRIFAGKPANTGEAA